jgi:hypothetical protein
MYMIIGRDSNTSKNRYIVSVTKLSAPISEPVQGGDYHELARIVAAWPSLPVAIRRAILALIDSAV